MMKRIISGLILIFCLSLVSQAQRNPYEVSRQTAKYQRLIGLIDAFYVDTVDIAGLTEDAIIRVLKDLDPHSVYISRQDIARMSEALEGGFSGIGIQYSLLRDTLTIIQTIKDGPAENAGLRPGDRVIGIDGEDIAGVGVTEEKIRNKLKGDPGTIVSMIISRRGEVIPFTVKRGRVPIYSVNSFYMLDDRTGYIHLEQFGINSIEEFEEAVIELKSQGMKNLILDLQGNGGGYMGAAIGICDNFLGNHQMIVYTDNPYGGEEKEYATAAGLMEEGRVAIIIDRNSASASEIVAGAIQDWDRGIIVGRRSFGKGLVQKQFPLTDGSMIRLTISHYYTPSGRCIQKPYEDSNYRGELASRFETGEMFSKDSITTDESLKFYTIKRRRPVYAGGGIIPDVFVPIDTSTNYTYLNTLVANNIIGDYIVDYIDKERYTLKRKYPTFKSFNRNFRVSDSMLDAIERKAEQQGIIKDEEAYNAIKPALRTQIKALIARDIWDTNEMYIVLNKDDKSIKKALQILNDRDKYNEILE